MAEPAPKLKVAGGTRAASALAPMRRPVGDMAGVLGLGVGFAVLVIAAVFGGAPSAFLDVPSILIVVGGTFAVTMISFSLPEIWRAQRLLFLALFQGVPDCGEAARRVVELARLARTEGVLVLERQLIQLRDAPFLRRAVGLVVDGATPEDVETVMGLEQAAIQDRHAKSASILRKAAEVAPAMGLIGTLVGLVQMLGQLDNPSAIGPAMAVALLTTFYGAVLANMVFAPLAAKLDRNSGEEALVNRLYVIGAMAIGRQENPTRLEMLLNTVLPPDKRLGPSE
jgi:chemotaxis protein MotA